MKTTKRKTPLLYPIIVLLIIAVALLPRFFSEESEKKTTASVTTGQNCTLTLSFLDVGQGAATLLAHNGDFVLIDTGDSFAKDALFLDLEAAGVTALDYVVVSHPHSDHMANLDDIIGSYPVDHVVLNDMDYDSKMWQETVAEINEKGINTVHPMADDTFSIGDVTFTVLNLTKDPNDYSETNDSSIVLKVSHGNDDFMFCGDATVYVENELIYRYDNALDIEVYAVSHHGSYLSNSLQFLQALSPQYNIISVGANNQYDHPNKETLDRLKKVGGILYRTDTYGNVTMTSNGNGIKIKE